MVAGEFNAVFDVKGVGKVFKTEYKVQITSGTVDVLGKMVVYRDLGVKASDYVNLNGLLPRGNSIMRIVIPFEKFLCESSGRLVDYAGHEYIIISLSNGHFTYDMYLEKADAGVLMGIFQLIEIAYYDKKGPSWYSFWKTYVDGRNLNGFILELKKQTVNPQKELGTYAEHTELRSALSKFSG